MKNKKAIAIFLSLVMYAGVASAGIDIDYGSGSSSKSGQKSSSHSSSSNNTPSHSDDDQEPTKEKKKKAPPAEQNTTATNSTKPPKPVNTQSGGIKRIKKADKTCTLTFGCNGYNR